MVSVTLATNYFGETEYTKVPISNGLIIKWDKGKKQRQISSKRSSVDGSAQDLIINNSKCIHGCPKFTQNLNVVAFWRYSVTNKKIVMRLIFIL